KKSMVRKIANIMRTRRTVITASCLASEGFLLCQRFGCFALYTFRKAFGIPNQRLRKIVAMNACKWRRLFALCSHVANRIYARVAFFNDVIRCVLQLEIYGMSPSALVPVQYHQRNQ